jgi:hypothetical protein
VRRTGLDHASARALAFVARRIDAEPIALILVVCDPGDVAAFEGLATLVLEGLPETDARALLASEIHAPLDEPVRDRILAEARGVPLALLELARSAGPAQMAGGYSVPGTSPLSSRIEDGYRDRLRVLQPDTQLLLVAAAAEPTGDPTLLWQAAAWLGIAPSAVALAEAVRPVWRVPRQSRPDAR